MQHFLEIVIAFVMYSPSSNMEYNLMSYGLTLHPPEHSNEEGMTAIHQVGFNAISSDWPVMPNPIEAIQKGRVVAELCDLYPSVEVFRSTYDHSAFGGGVGSLIELTIQGGPQVSLFHLVAGITVPYWYQQEHLVRLVFEQTRKCIAVIEDSLGYTTYDTQIGRIVNMPDDLDEMMEAYMHTMGLIRKHIG